MSKFLSTVDDAVVDRAVRCLNGIESAGRVRGRIHGLLRKFIAPAMQDRRVETAISLVPLLEPVSDQDSFLLAVLDRIQAELAQAPAATTGEQDDCTPEAASDHTDPTPPVKPVATKPKAPPNSTARAPKASPAVRQSPQFIDLDNIRVDHDIQSRECLNQETVQQYAEAMASGDSFPPILVIKTESDSTTFLVDGFHRVAAARQARLTRLPANTRSGTRRDAVLIAAGSNAEHGLPRTNADKRKAVQALLQDEEWSMWSDGEISRRCRVSQPFVSKLRRELGDAGTTQSRVRTYSRDGRKHRMKTAPIGSKRASRTPRSQAETQPIVLVVEQAEAAQGSRLRSGALLVPNKRMSQVDATTTVVGLVDSMTASTGVVEWRSHSLAPDRVRDVLGAVAEVRARQFSTEAGNGGVIRAMLMRMASPDMDVPEAG